MTSNQTGHGGCWFLTGPTASGKTAVGIELADRMGAEIISVDSMAQYRRMDIGTAKPTADQRARVAHHLVDILDPHEESSVAQYCTAAQQVADEIRKRGKQVLFVGGSPLYLKALFRGLFDGPPADWGLRHSIEAWARAAAPGALHARLAEVDPVAASRLHPHDARRLIRAIEVYERTGEPISKSQTQFDNARPDAGHTAFVLNWPRDVLYRRIDARVDEMFAAGLVAETEALLAAERPPGRTARQALGYREVIVHFEQQVPLDQTIDRVKIKSRQFAKRQLTWFRQLRELEPFDIAALFDPAEVAEAMFKAGSARLTRFRSDTP